MSKKIINKGNEIKNDIKKNKILIKCANKKNIALHITLLISIAFIIIATILLLIWLKDNYNTQNIANEIINDCDIDEISDENSANIELVLPPNDNNKSDYWDFVKLPLISVDFDKLLGINKDTVGWINVRNTNINYPFVQTNNNFDYLNKAFDGTPNKAGWLFADYRNNIKSFDKNTIIYGHSRLNKTMFGSLKNVLSQDWFNNKDNYVIRLSTPTENTMWQIFSVYKTNVESYYLSTTFKNDNEYLSFLNTIKSRSKFDFNVNLIPDNKILTLSTCSDIAGTGRIVVHASLIKQEKR